MGNDPRISKIFYYFEKNTTIESGRTAGRKIGVVQEILCKKLLLTSEAIRDCICFEPKMHGLSGATHKVEFFLFRPVAVVALSAGRSYSITPSVSIKVVAVDAANQSAKLTYVGHSKNRATVKAGEILRIADTTLLIKFVRVEQNAIRFSVLDISQPLASIESKRVGAQRFSGSDKLGSGIQTIEKAKQASLVAIDFDLRYNKTLLTQTKDKDQRAFKSFVVLGNGVHWTDHDLAILETYVDFTYLATDDAVIRYAEFVRAIALKQKAEFFKFFMAYFQGMTKTPPDSFTVTNSDFTVVRPKDAGPFLETVAKQIPPYKVTVI